MSSAKLHARWVMLTRRQFWQAHEGHEGEPQDDCNPSWGLTGSGLCLSDEGTLELVLPPVSISVVAF